MKYSKLSTRIFSIAFLCYTFHVFLPNQVNTFLLRLTEGDKDFTLYWKYANIFQVDSYRNCLKNRAPAKIARRENVDSFVVFNDIDQKKSFGFGSSCTGIICTQTSSSLDPICIETTSDSDSVGFWSWDTDNGLIINQFRSDAFKHICILNGVVNMIYVTLK